MKKFAVLSMALAMFSLTACENMQQGNKQILGGAGGAVVGGLLGSQVGGGSGQLWATGAGAVLGALAGSEIGRSLDKADMVYAQRAHQQAYTAPIGETVRWNNPDSGHYGTVTPTRDGYSSSGRYCREYSQTVYVGGKQQQAYGQACQQPDGTWEIVPG
ncbi:MAG: glycine zipper 2TM domain-containing protein [Alphaproteobacteria bacterium]|nr:glycine zipper 2TM domain-containing protein [Alphaproteobacteria bacterium]